MLVTELISMSWDRDVEVEEEEEEVEDDPKN